MELKNKAILYFSILVPICKRFIILIFGNPCKTYDFRTGNTPKSYHNLPAHGSCAVFVVFRQISVKQKPHRAHTTFDLEHCFFLLSIFDTIDNAQDFGQNTLSDLKLPVAPPEQMLFLEYSLFGIP